MNTRNNPESEENAEMTRDNQRAVFAAKMQAREEEGECPHDENDHGVCLECGEDINDRLQDAAEYRKDAIENR